MDGYERTAEIFKVLGHPVRLQIVQVLRQEEACVCHLEALLGQRQAYISQHLMKLRDAGLVVDRREGLNVFYSLAHKNTITALLDAAHSTAHKVEGRAVDFDDPRSGLEVGCTCPKCQPVPAQKVVQSS